MNINLCDVQNENDISPPFHSIILFIDGCVRKQRNSVTTVTKSAHIICLVTCGCKKALFYFTL